LLQTILSIDESNAAVFLTKWRQTETIASNENQRTASSNTQPLRQCYDWWQIILYHWSIIIAKQLVVQRINRHSSHCGTNCQQFINKMKIRTASGTSGAAQRQRLSFGVIWHLDQCKIHWWNIDWGIFAKMSNRFAFVFAHQYMYRRQLF